MLIKRKTLWKKTLFHRSDELYQAQDIYQLDYVEVTSKTATKPIATVKLKTVDNKVIEMQGEGAGSVDAIYKTIEKMIGESIDLIDYTLQSITGGTDALGEVIVHIRDKDRVFTGRVPQLMCFYLQLKLMLML